ncbi:hypothetical protein IEQ11_21990 [Lysobacter capsici]|uniref:hypothetical protein n=2 Tax=Lysobacter capsici TaxID=435897 RepID=UPI001787719B|nr:hypothetical protein [Lysobacter capsici]UOF14360.1 hypothetical protein IEQ11_21990 [Lysobacter capsici]
MADSGSDRADAVDAPDRVSAQAVSAAHSSQTPDNNRSRARRIVVTCKLFFKGYSVSSKPVN